MSYEKSLKEAKRLRKRKWLFANLSCLLKLFAFPERAGAEVVECACLIGLPKFKVPLYFFCQGQPIYCLLTQFDKGHQGSIPPPAQSEGKESHL